MCITQIFKNKFGNDTLELLKIVLQKAQCPLIKIKGHMYEKKAMKPNNIHQNHQKYHMLSKGLKEYTPFSHKSFIELAKLIYISSFFLLNQPVSFFNCDFILNHIPHQKRKNPSLA